MSEACFLDQFRKAINNKTHPLSQSYQRMQKAERLSRLWNKSTKNEYQIAQQLFQQAFLQIMVDCYRGMLFHPPNDVVYSSITFSKFKRKSEIVDKIKLAGPNASILTVDELRFIKKNIGNIMIPKTFMAYELKNVLRTLILLAQQLPLFTVEEEVIETFRKHRLLELKQNAEGDEQANERSSILMGLQSEKQWER